MKNILLPMAIGLAVIVTHSLNGFNMEAGASSVKKKAETETLQCQNLSFESLLSLAKEGNVVAQFCVANAYNAGEKIKHDILKAEEWHLKAAEQGHAGAQNQLANLYFRGKRHLDGTGVNKDEKKGMAFLLAAVDQGDPNALYSLASNYHMGAHVPLDLDKAIEFYERAHEKGNLMAALTLGHMYREGVNLVEAEVPQNNEKALFWFEKAVAMGDSNAQDVINEMKGIKPENKSQKKSIELTNALDREDFLELYDLDQYIGNDQQECVRAGYSYIDCMCDLKDEYKEMSALIKDIAERHPDWVGSGLSFHGKRAHTGFPKHMNGQMINTGIGTSWRVITSKAKTFEKKICSKE